MPRIRSLPLLGLLLASLPLPAAAQNAEYRSIELTDGRLLRGVVRQSTDSGMEVEIPQGVVAAPYELLANLGVIEQADVMKQPPLRVAIAPIVAGNEDDRALARGVEGWLADAVGLMPKTEVSSAAAWRASLSPADAIKLRACGENAGCLTGLAASVQPIFVLVPKVEARAGGASLLLRGYVAATGTALGEGRTPVGPDRAEHAAGVARAAFQSCLIGPTFDLEEAAARVFPRVGPAVAGGPGEAAGPGDGGASDELRERGEEEEEDLADLEEPLVKPTARAPAASGPSTLGRTIALGFLPVPGLNSAVDGNVPAFVVSLAGTVGASWLTVYGVGWKARTAPEFWAPSVLLSYAINVGFNEIVGIIGWHVKHRPAGAASLRRPRPRLAGSAAPWLAPDATGRTRASGAAVLLNGSW